MPPNWPLDTKCCPSFRLTQHTANKLPNAAYHLSCASTRHVVQQTNQTNMLCIMRTDWPPNTTWKVTLTVVLYFSPFLILSLITHDYRLSLIFFPLLRSVLNLLSIFAMSDGLLLTLSNHLKVCSPCSCPISRPTLYTAQPHAAQHAAQDILLPIMLPNTLHC